MIYYDRQVLCKVKFYLEWFFFINLTVLSLWKQCILCPAHILCVVSRFEATEVNNIPALGKVTLGNMLDIWLTLTWCEEWSCLCHEMSQSTEWCILLCMKERWQAVSTEEGTFQLCRERGERIFQTETITGILGRRNREAALRNSLRARQWWRSVRAEARRLGWGRLWGPWVPHGKGRLLHSGGSPRSRCSRTSIFYNSASLVPGKD